MLELVLRLVFSLLVVIGLLLLLARLAQKKLRGGSGALIRVVARQQLSRSSAIAVVNVADRILVVGATENGIRLLTELDPDSLDVDPAEPTVPIAVDRAPSGLPAAQAGPLAGSLLSPQTWKQAMMAAQRGHRTAGDDAMEP